MHFVARPQRDRSSRRKSLWKLRVFHVHFVALSTCTLSRKPLVAVRIPLLTRPVLWTDAAARRRPRPAGRGTARGQRCALPPARPTRRPSAHSPKRPAIRLSQTNPGQHQQPRDREAVTRPRGSLEPSLAPRRPRRQNHPGHPGPGPLAPRAHRLRLLPDASRGFDVASGTATQE